MEHDDSMCEQHEFRDVDMERKMNELTDRLVLEKSRVVGPGRL
jgi:hypothetical protein